VTTGAGSLDSGLERAVRYRTERRSLAVSRARLTCETLSRIGVSAKIFGSLATGGFEIDSDVDILVTDCPRALKYAIEGLVEDCLDGLPFDVVYLDEASPLKRDHFLREAVDAGRLR
jgi:predicted nucleotidyltransferase